MVCWTSPKSHWEPSAGPAIACLLACHVCTLSQLHHTKACQLSSRANVHYTLPTRQHRTPVSHFLQSPVLTVSPLCGSGHILVSRSCWAATLVVINAQFALLPRPNLLGRSLTCYNWTLWVRRPNVVMALPHRIR